MDNVSNYTILDLDSLQKAMEAQYLDKDEEFCLTETFYELQSTCSIHHAGHKDIFAQRYSCLNCSKYLNKVLRKTQD